MDQTPNQYKLVEDFNRILIERWIKNIRKLKIGDTHELEKSFNSSVFGSTDSVNKTQFSYLLRGQFVDMGVGKGQHIGAIKGNKEDLKAAGIHGRSEGRHAKKWYSKTMYAESAVLAELLQENFGIRSQNTILENLPEKIQ